MKRLLRGWLAAGLITLLAAGGHSLAHVGGEAGHSDHGVAPIVWIFTLVLAGPICTALAGRRWSRLRTLGAIALSQCLFHIFFTLFGAAGSARTTVSGNGHGHHLESLTVQTVETAHVMPAAGTLLGGLMLLAHLLAAAGAYAVVHHGESTAFRLLDLLLLAGSRRLLRAAEQNPAASPRRAVTIGTQPAPRRYLLLTEASPRGPPVPSLP